MDFNLSNEQRSWQMAARKFADEEIRPISLERDTISKPRETWDWEIIKKGSKLGFRTMAVPKEWGGHGTDFVTQALVMTELAKADSAISKAFSQNWKWSHLISASCTEEQKQRFLPGFVADDGWVLGKGITEPSAGSDNRMPQDDPKTGIKLRAERKGDEWILNGEKAFIANAPVGKLFFIDARTDATVPPKQGTTLFLVPSDTPGFRIGKVFNKSGWRFYQNGEMIFENARVPHANVVGEVGGAIRKTGGGGGDTTGGDLFGRRRLGCCLFQGHEHRAFVGEPVDQAFERQHAVAAADHEGMHGVGEHAPVDRLLHVEEFVEPAFHHRARRLQAGQDGGRCTHEFEMRKVVERPTDRHFDERGRLTKMERLAKLGDVAAPRAIGKVVGAHQARVVGEAVLQQQIDRVLAQVPGRRTVAARLAPGQPRDRVIGAHQIGFLLVAALVRRRNMRPAVMADLVAGLRPPPRIRAASSRW